MEQTKKATFILYQEISPQNHNTEVNTCSIPLNIRHFNFSTWVIAKAAGNSGQSSLQHSLKGSGTMITNKGNKLQANTEIGIVSRLLQLVPLSSRENPEVGRTED